ncbi:MAG TPA: HD domain-containing protein [Thermohalobaculum sp.]|nr:HD domain-containing protein [Thermohalobaculum sp.]
MSDVLLLARAFAFAAEHHSGQTRKGEASEPYVNHVADVARRVAEATGGSDARLVAAALLHDTVEDTRATEEDIRTAFGDDVADLVMEVTDDRTLPKDARKQAQVDHAPHLSDRAKRLKLADKASNLTQIVESPPADWPAARKRDYADWAEAVLAGLRGVDAEMERTLEHAIARVRAEAQG